MPSKTLISKLRDFPKADLHVHLDGSLRLGTLIELAQAQKVSLPSYTESGLKELVFKNSYNDLPEYLEGFKYTCAVMQDTESLERIAYEFAWDCFQDGVVYVEPRYSPELLRNNGLSVEDVILAIDKGLKRAQGEINSLIAKENQSLSLFKKPSDARLASLENAELTMPSMSSSRDSRNPDATLRTGSADVAWSVGSSHPNFVYSHIVCAMRMWAPERSLETIMAAVRVRDKHGLPIAALDLAGPEAGFPAMDHQDAYIYAHKNFMYKTVHAGEAYGPPSIFQALTYLYADRIGHGFHLFSKELTNRENINDANHYIENLKRYIAEKRITLEVCLTSNLQTLPELKGDPHNHSLPKMLEAGISVALCTDNMLVSNTTVTKELALAVETFKLDSKKIKKLIMYGIKRGFYPGSYAEKKQYVDTCSKYYDYLAATVII